MKGVRKCDYNLSSNLKKWLDWTRGAIFFDFFLPSAKAGNCVGLYEEWRIYTVRFIIHYIYVVVYKLNNESSKRIGRIVCGLCRRTVIGFGGDSFRLFGDLFFFQSVRI